jgi:hypothetical protein
MGLKTPVTTLFKFRKLRWLDLSGNEQVTSMSREVLTHFPDLETAKFEGTLCDLAAANVPPLSLHGPSFTVAFLWPLFNRLVELQSTCTSSTSRDIEIAEIQQLLACPGKLYTNVL